MTDCESCAHRRDSVPNEICVYRLKGCPVKECPKYKPKGGKHE